MTGALMSGSDGVRRRLSAARAERRLQDQAEQDAGRAPDEIVPEIADAEREVERKHKALGRQRGPENRRPAHAPEKERDQEQGKQDSVKNGTDDVDGLYEVFGHVRNCLLY